MYLVKASVTFLPFAEVLRGLNRLAWTCWFGLVGWGRLEIRLGASGPCFLRIWLWGPLEVGSAVGVHVGTEVALGSPFLCLADAVVPGKEMAMDFLQDGRDQGMWEERSTQLHSDWNLILFQMKLPSRKESFCWSRMARWSWRSWGCSCKVRNHLRWPTKRLASWVDWRSLGIQEMGCTAALGEKWHDWQFGILLELDLKIAGLHGIFKPVEHLSVHLAKKFPPCGGPKIVRRGAPLGRGHSDPCPRWQLGAWGGREGSSFRVSGVSS